MFSPGFEHLSALFNRMLYEDKLHTAAQVAVLINGQPMVDHAAGTERYGDITPQTPFVVFSVTKAFTGMCIHKLIEEGKIDLDAPVAEYWPQFGCKGKETATIRHVFLHQAGIPATGLNKQVFTWPFWPLVTRNVAGQTAEYVPGTKTAYHLVNYGFIFGEVVRRVTGKSIDKFARETFFQPMQLQNTYMRLPSRLLSTSPRLIPLVPSKKTATRLFNLSPIRLALNPSAGLHSTARELAEFFSMLEQGGVYNGQRLVKQSTVDAATTTGYDGYDAYIQVNMHWGYGFILGGGQFQNEDKSRWAYGRLSTARTFGALGMGTCMVWADPQAHLVVAFTCNGMLDNSRASDRWAAISNALWDDLYGR